MTGQEGRFTISNVSAATYIVTLEKPGFVFLPDRHEKGGNYFHITVDRGREPVGLKLEMTARAIISGHVLDEYGEPMPDIAVQLVPVRKDWVGEIAYGNSDDRGEFRFSSPPGRYYIKAGTSRSSSADQMEIRTDGTTETVYRETYYPDAVSREGAELIDLRAGKEIGGIEIRLKHTPALAISGFVSGVPESVTSLSVTLSSGNSSYSIAFNPQDNQDGRFTFSDLAPGSYRVYATTARRSDDLWSQIAAVNLTNSSVTVHLLLRTGSDLKGAVETIGISQQERKALGERFVNLQSLEGSPSISVTAPVALNGTFLLKGIQPGRYLVDMKPLPENGYVKAIRLNETRVQKNTLDLSDGAEGLSLNILVDADGGGISGLVEDEDGRATRLPAQVILRPEGNEPDVFSEVDALGNYTFKGIAPGRYRLLATTGDLVGDLLDHKGTSGDLVLVKQGDRIHKNVKVDAFKRDQPKP